MTPFNSRQLHLQSFEELAPRLPAGNPIAAAFERSRKKSQFLDRLFFVYEGDIECNVLCMGLDLFHPNRLRYGLAQEPHIYPIVIGNLILGSAYFDGYVTGNITARTLYLENRMEPIHAGCGGNLEVKRLLFIRRRTLQAAGDATVHTLLSSNDGALSAMNQHIAHRFDFPKIKRADDFSRHSKAQVRAHFDAFACGDGLDRIDMFYGTDVDGMLPLKSTADEQDLDYVLVDR